MTNWFHYNNYGTKQGLNLVTKGMSPTVTKYADLRNIGIGWFAVVFRKYVQFSGRASRKEYWMFVLTQIAIIFVLWTLSVLMARIVAHSLTKTATGIVTNAATDKTDKPIDPMAMKAGNVIVSHHISGFLMVFLSSCIKYILLTIFVLATLLPSFALQVRRLHDRGLSGWFCLVPLIPFVGWTIGWVALLTLSSLDSQRSDNAYGQYPKEASNIAVNEPPNRTPV
ncbi:MAG: DUF805 domain-containing protein [Planctomycetaceae bacterium]|jgi:uncharacterized membrane protein YhaH (DUF805 family)|nr:DUF805 domain-containing protein [Planctomycetaceae bacterium]